MPPGSRISKRKPMSKSKNNIIGITMGDPAGIGPEVIAKALSAYPARKLEKPIAIIGDYSVFRALHCRLPKNCASVIFIDLKNMPSSKLTMGRPGLQSARASLEYLDESLSLLRGGKISALVTGPVCKEAICSLGQKFQGHTERIAHYFNVRDYEMMFVADSIKTVIATRHIPLNEVSNQIRAPGVFTTIALTFLALKNNFRIKNPKIAVCGLNPHAGEGGTIGKEETREIMPALKKARLKGIDVSGPFAADTLFVPLYAKKYDAIIAMYHDQGLAPVKALYFNKLVNLTIGLPFIRTSPAHGTAFNIAGKNKADPTSMLEAIKLAARLCP